MGRKPYILFQFGWASPLVWPSPLHWPSLLGESNPRWCLVRAHRARPLPSPGGTLGSLFFIHRMGRSVQNAQPGQQPQGPLPAPSITEVRWVISHLTSSHLDAERHIVQYVRWTWNIHVLSGKTQTTDPRRWIIYLWGKGLGRGRRPEMPWPNLFVSGKGNRVNRTWES